MGLRKTVTRENAHAVFSTPDGSWKWYVLKTYKAAKNEAGDPYARWFTLVTSPFVGEAGEMGDTYAKDIRGSGMLIAASSEWTEAYGEVPNG